MADENTELKEALDSTAAAVTRPKDAPGIFFGLPSMTTMNVGLVNKLFSWAQSMKFSPWFHFLTEKRHVDFARNMLKDAFLKTPNAYMLMVDEDVDPHINLPELCFLDKDVIGGNTYCWINNELMPSIWQRAECEECVVVRKFRDEGINHDRRTYVITHDGEQLDRWNPFIGCFQPFYLKTGKGYYKSKCRCKGSGWDPWVYRTHQGIVGAAGLMQCDSVGGASMMIARRVLEKMQGNCVPFSYLYRPSREILLTEDHYFCWRAKEMGFEVWGDPQMVCSHYKTVDLWAIQRHVIKSYTHGMNYQKSVMEAERSIVVPSEDEILSLGK